MDTPQFLDQSYATNVIAYATYTTYMTNANLNRQTKSVPIEFSL